MYLFKCYIIKKIPPQGSGNLFKLFIYEIGRDQLDIHCYIFDQKRNYTTIY